MNLFESISNGFERLIQTIVGYSWLLLLSSGAFVLLPKKYLEVIGVREIAIEYQTIIGLLFLISFFHVLGTLIKYFFDLVQRNSYVDYQLQSLDSTEEAIVQNCLERNSPTYYGDHVDAALNSLLMKNLMCHGSGEINNLPYIFTNSAWKRIIKKFSK